MSNPGVPVTGAETVNNGAIEVRGGDNPMTFDELDTLTSDKKGKKAEAKEPKAEAKDAKSKDLTSDTDKGKKYESKKAEKSEKAESKEAKAESKEVKDEEIKPPRKTIKAKYAENEYDLDEEAVVTVKINGKDEEVQIKDILSNYSGKTAWDKKFSELDKTRKGIGAKEMKLKEIEGKVQSIFSEQDPQLRLYKMAELSGVNPAEFRAKYLEENINMLEKWYNMSDDERKADALSFENQYLKHQHETHQAATKQQQAQKELRAKIDQLRAPHGISDDTFVDRFEELKSHVAQGTLSKEQMTPEFVVETIVKDNLWNAAAEKLSTYDLGWSEQARGENLLKLVENAYTVGLKPQDLPDIVDELWGKTAQKTKVEQKQKAKEEFLSGKKEVAQVKTKKEEPLFFEDI